MKSFYDLKINKNLIKILTEILSSFVWANTDSIERYKVTAQKMGVLYEDWEKIKGASLIFDKYKLMTDTFQPDVTILLKWTKEENWLLESLMIEKKEIIKKHLWYYKIKTENGFSHIFWTYHPLGMPRNGISQELLIDEIISFYSKDK